MDPANVSKGLAIVTPELVIKQLRDHYRSTSIVEVGSGNGAFANLISLELGINVTTIDPDTTGTGYLRRSTIVRKANFPRVADYIRSSPIGPGEQSCLVLNWPDPSTTAYDLEAIIKLVPRQVLIIVDSTGGAGSTELLTWMHSRDFLRGDLFGGVRAAPITPMWMERYKPVFSIVRDSDAFVYTSIMLELDYDKDVDTDYAKIAPEQDPCVIM